MALITYLTRVHFADGILEETLRSELERHRCRRLVIVAEKEMLEAGLVDRLYAGFPVCTKPAVFEVSPGVPVNSAVAELKTSFLEY